MISNVVITPVTKLVGHRLIPEAWDVALLGPWEKVREGVSLQVCVRRETFRTQEEALSRKASLDAMQSSKEKESGHVKEE